MSPVSLCYPPYDVVRLKPKYVLNITVLKVFWDTFPDDSPLRAELASLLGVSVVV